MMIAKQLVRDGDRNTDQQLTRDELVSVVAVWFEALDSDGLGRVKQDEFVSKFQKLLSVGEAGPTTAPRIFALASSALSFFTVADQNHDVSLDRAELNQIFEEWSHAWDGDADGTLGEAELVRGLNAVLPKTNMSGVPGRTSQDSIRGLPTPPPSPVLSAPESMATIRVVEGFRIELAASEPMIEDPVALSFDEDGRAFVVEMRSYMADIDRGGEHEPISRISRLEDVDGDGRFDRATVFVDGLILPRAVAATAGGILYVSDYKLHFARDTDGDGKADRTEIVDAEYGRGNVEHAPNGLFRAMDNWIYNGESPYRYRLVNGTLIKQLTEVRGQWGMTQDNYGRLFYNVNSSQLLGDYAPPNYIGRNPHHASSAGLNLFVATDQRVFPIRMTTAINRGYSPEVLSPEGKAYVFASSCSPVVYRGDNYPGEFVGNAFVLDPALNLIKRNLVFDQELTLASRFAYEDHEFLASTDERFRPSNLYNGPDGTLWFVDLYRGIAQYGQFMTDYLRRETLSRGLEQGIHLGRIYRIVSTTNRPKAGPRLSAESSMALIERLSDANGWIRDTAQRLLVERGDRSVAAELTELVEKGSEPLGRIHALWTLEGLFASLPGQSTATPGDTPEVLRLLDVDSSFLLEAPELPSEVLETCLRAITDPNSKVQVAAIRVAEALTTRNAIAQRKLLHALEQLGAETPVEAVFQAALSAGRLPKPDAIPLLARLVTTSTEHRLIREAVLCGLANWELQFLEGLLRDPQWMNPRAGCASLLQSLASAIIKERDHGKIEVLLELAASQPENQSWRRRSLLDGVVANIGNRPMRLISFPAEPAALASMRNSDDAQTRKQSERSEALFAWPGHQLDKATAEMSKARTLTTAEVASINEGKVLFQQLCAGCHGIEGQGIAPMAPPLANSEWVLGPIERLVRIILHGVTGPIEVNGMRYAPPHILPEMPGLEMLPDVQIASVSSYLRRAWGHQGDPITEGDVVAIRLKTGAQKTPWTAAQLLKIE